jgi:hypothetical protein
MAAELELWAQTAANSTRLALTAQLALAGQLASVLVASGALSAQQASEMLTKIADMISASVDDAATDLQSVLIAPVREHADALRRLASDLQKFSGPDRPEG